MDVESRLTQLNRRGKLRASSLSAILAFAGILLGADVTAGSPGDTGIHGTVLMGAVSPGPSRPGQSEEEPASVAFLVMQGNAQVATFRSGADGQFHLLLPPGDYVLVPQENTPIPFPQTQTTGVTVPADGLIEIVIRLDTGMK